MFARVVDADEVGYLPALCLVDFVVSFHPQRIAGMAALVFCHLLGCADADDFTAGIAAFWAEVDDPIGSADDVEVVFDDDEAVAAREELFEGLVQRRDVVEVEAGGWFVEEEECAAACCLREVAGEFEALGFAAGECRDWLAEFDVAEADGAERFDDTQDFFFAGEEFTGFVDGDVEDVGDRFAGDFDFENHVAIAAAVAVGAAEVDVAEELHFDVLETVAVAGGAPAFAAVEAERAGAVAAFFGEGLPGEEFSDFVECTDVAGGVGAGGLADGRLIDHDHVFDLGVAGDAFVFAGLFGGFVFEAEEAAVEDVFDERALAGATDAGDADEPVERNRNVDGFEVMFRRSANADGMVVFGFHAKRTSSMSVDCTRSSDSARPFGSPLALRLALLGLPEPLTPVMQTSRLRGISTLTDLRLCSDAPRIAMELLVRCLTLNYAHCSRATFRRKHESLSVWRADWR